MRAEAVVFISKNKATFREVEIPEPGTRDVVVQTKYSWISTGTERSYLRGERVDGETPVREGTQPPFPIVPGYQKTGIVQWVGEEVEGIRPGEWVFAATSKVDLGPMKMGGHVSPAVTPMESIWKVPEGVDPIAVSGLVLVQVGYNCAARPPVRKGDVAVVIGDGLVGQWAAQVLAHRGAKVILVGRHDSRLQRLRAGPWIPGYSPRASRPLHGAPSRSRSLPVRRSRPNTSSSGCRHSPGFALRVVTFPSSRY